MFWLFLMCSATAEKVASKSVMLHMWVCKQFCWGDAAEAVTCFCSGVYVEGAGGCVTGVLGQLLLGVQLVEKHFALLQEVGAWITELHM